MKAPRFQVRCFPDSEEAAVYLDGLQVDQMGVTSMTCYYDHSTRTRSLTTAEVIVLASIMEAVEGFCLTEAKND